MNREERMEKHIDMGLDLLEKVADYVYDLEKYMVDGKYEILKRIGKLNRRIEELEEEIRELKEEKN